MDDTSPALRASDADRQKVVDRLSEHAAAGRLEPAELEERVARALAARSEADLDPLLADLPRESRPRRQGRRRGRVDPDELRAYLSVMLLLVAIWAFTGAGYFWPAWPALGWGVGLLIPCGSPGKRRHRGAHA